MKRLLVVLFVLVLTAGLALAQTEVTKTEDVKPAVKKAEMLGEITVKTIPAMTAVMVMAKAADYIPEGGYPKGNEGSTMAYETMVSKGFEILTAWMKEGGKPIGPPFAIYPEDPSKTPAKDLTCQIGFPVEPGTKVTARLKVESYPETSCAVVQFKGAYNQSRDVWQAFKKWIPDNGYIPTGAPMEVYLKTAEDKVPPEEFITEIRQPVKKAEEKKAEEPKSEGTGK
ncbi:GyrI-like domain-containing protein [candidate division KSB1 bacterium]|nr:MAG: GyrI-like domain-containing protein [candidate division KSB1 bacterium]